MRRYIFIALLFGLVLIVSKSIYDQMNKGGASAKRLDCHTKSVVFEKVLSPLHVKELQNVLRGQDIDITIATRPAKYMQTQLFEHVDILEIKKQTKEALKQYKASSPTTKKGSISIIVYENDKLDPGKKTAKSKLYAGYLIYTFVLDDTPVYKIQIDFMDDKGGDIAQKIVCALQSVMSL